MKNGGGHFAPKLGGHFELESGGHFKLELGGQYHWNLHSYALFLELKKESKNVEYRDSSDDIPWIYINWKGKSYYIQEEDDGNFSFGFCKGNNDQIGLKEMQQNIEKIILKNNLQKRE
ncbi:MAG: hypothetical protein L6Q46_07280 [Flavobacterium sp.]|uniref:hypothetical protein n=1 Tax=Flavobacterium sp. TaxID=239 RepID=UPI0025C32850|nr:hypothetical protein [Flavobacterium sp.]MCK6608090.1 hypothetical protein [Flavobacterium sp.]